MPCMSPQLPHFNNGSSKIEPLQLVVSLVVLGILFVMTRRINVLSDSDQLTPPDINLCCSSRGRSVAICCPLSALRHHLFVEMLSSCQRSCRLRSTSHSACLEWCRRYLKGIGTTKN